MTCASLLDSIRNWYIGRQAQIQNNSTERRQTRALKTCKHERTWPSTDKHARWKHTGISLLGTAWEHVRIWQSADKHTQWNLTEHSQTRDDSQKYSRTRTRASKKCSKDFLVLKHFNKRKKWLLSGPRSFGDDKALESALHRACWETVASWPDHNKLEKKLWSASWCDTPFWASHLSTFCQPKQSWVF